MKYLKKFNESISEEDIKDYILSYFNRDVFLEDSSENNYFYFSSYDITEDEIVGLEKYLKSGRFSGYSYIISKEKDFTDFIIIKDSFRNKHTDIDVKNLKWVRHTLAEYDRGGLFSNAKMVVGLPNNCSLISGLNYNKTMEFWRSDLMDDPMNLTTNACLQCLLYKYAT